MITSIIFSKDRPLQLDLTLKSIKENFKLSNLKIVIYKASPGFEASYDQLQIEHPKVVFIKQSGYLIDSILSERASFGSHICFFTDDDIFYRKSLTTEQELVLVTQTACLSLRLGINTTKRDYGDGILRDDKLPLDITSSATKKFLFWNRLSLPPGGYWAYPLSVDGHVFDSAKILAILDTMKNWPETYSTIQTPNKFEAMLQRFFFEIPITMMCEKYSCVVNSPNNRVQSEYENSNGLQFSYSPKVLNDLYMEGKRICLDNLVFQVICPHQEIEILKGIT